MIGVRLTEGTDLGDALKEIARVSPLAVSFDVTSEARVVNVIPRDVSQVAAIAIALERAHIGDVFLDMR